MNRQSEIEVPLDLDVDHITTWDEMVAIADPVELMLARGVIPMSWLGVAAIMPDLFETENAAKMHFRKNHPELGQKYDEVVAALSAGAVDFVSFPYRDSYRGLTRTRTALRDGVPADLVEVRYRREGTRQCSTAFIDRRRHTDPRLTLIKFLGLLELFEPSSVVAVSSELRRPARQ